MLSGFGISGYRSFGKEFVKIDNLKKINVFIGANNSGKSNILTFCKHLSGILNKKQYDNFNELDFNIRDKVGDIRYSIKIDSKNELFKNIFENVQNILNPNKDHFAEWENSVWLEYNVKNNKADQSNESLKILSDKIQNTYTDTQSNYISGKHLGYTGGDHVKRCTDIAQKILNSKLPTFEVFFIEAFRRITNFNEEESLNSISGNGLIKKLRSLQSPELPRYGQDKEKFNIINDFLREILAEPTAYLEIPADKDEIYVSIKNKILPIESLGTGIHELIILAAAVTIKNDILFCIEEPEIHIHPILQKKFIKYLIDKTNNQYFITSHSNSFFDIPNVNLFHCYLNDGNTNCRLVSSDNDKLNILNDLGYKLSDLLLSNYIIWVEGPSDRIYLDYWISKKAPKLKEGFHYTIMFYGGRLLNHLSFDNEDYKNFILLCKIKHESAIVIDSDKKSRNSHLNDTKKRIIADFITNNQYVWITKGREIENYLNEETYNRVISNLYPHKYKTRIKWTQFSSLTRLNDKFMIDKITVAKSIAELDPDFSVLDLHKKTNKLIELINKAN